MNCDRCNLLLPSQPPIRQSVWRWRRSPPPPSEVGSDHTGTASRRERRQRNGTRAARHPWLARELKISPRLPLPRVGQADVDARPAETAGACARTDDMATIPFSPAFYASPLVFLSCSFRPRWRLWLWRWFSRHPVTGRQLLRSREGRLHGRVAFLGGKGIWKWRSQDVCSLHGSLTKWFCVQVQIWRKNVEPVRTRFCRLFVVANLLVPHLMIVDLRTGFHLKEKGKNFPNDSRHMKVHLISKTMSWFNLLINYITWFNLPHNGTCQFYFFILPPSPKEWRFRIQNVSQKEWRFA
jgi:hypothetical protein